MQEKNEDCKKKVEAPDNIRHNRQSQPASNAGRLNRPEIRRKKRSPKKRPPFFQIKLISPRNVAAEADKMRTWTKSPTFWSVRGKTTVLY